eukprot:CAMPEP_0119042688 /NCGR_PEP_ID=MMETSP1177-20130426/16084_1 /TAXON_ID=2985 /ORGANISM="Ochromonas sp, Strain CCMP1899" /LENGTH=565 /DNA_ID=CAMNT_0007009653 /DNA_START=205 /DNA_END=1902 /DNA_ORIENTATION=+
MASYGIGGSASTESAIPAKVMSKCPFTQTKAFIGRQTAFISNTFSFGSRSPSFSLNFQNLAVVPVTAPSTTTSMTALSLPFSIMPDLTVKRNRVRRCTKLQATTIDIVNAEIQVLVKEKRTKKKTVEALEVVVIGLSHHNAGVNVREKLAIPEDHWNSAATGLCEYDSISEAAVLSTCNRFEIYLSGQNQYECIRDAVSYLEKRAEGGLDQATLRRSLFMLSGEDAIWHLLKVGAGLDSLIIGEGQILAQVKSAYDHGLEEDGQSGKVVSRMLNAAVTGGKRVRSETGIAKGAVSISSAAAEFTAMKIRSDCGIQNGLEAANICMIGAGKMARLLLVHLGTQKVQKVTILNRSPDKVIELRKEFPEMTIDFEPMDNMWTVIQNSDVVYPSTSSTTTIIDKDPLIECLKGRTTRPGGIQFIDISVPRNVAADCAEIPGVFSYNVDDLKAVVERNTAKRRREMLEAEVILKEELSKYRLWQQSLGAIPTIAKLQEKAENMRLEELLKASKKLSNLSPKDLEAVDRLSKGIIAKLLHGPMNHLRQQGDGDSTRAAIQQLQQAFQLDNK